MKKITYYLIAFFFAAFSWQGMAQLTEDFEVEPLAGWTFQQTESDDPGFVITTTQAHGGSSSFYHNDDNIAAESTSYMVSPAHTVQAGEELAFWYYQNYSGSYYDYSGAWISTASNDPIANPGDFTELIEFGANGSEDTWTEFRTALTDYEGQTVYIAFKYTGDWADEIYIDDFSIKIPPACPDVTNIAASNFTASGSADLTWDASTDAVGYNWEIQPQGAEQGDGTMVEFGTATGMESATTSMLVSGTVYTLYIQSDCGSGDLGDWMSFNFTTPPANDDACNAEMLTLNAAPTVATNVSATGQTDEPSPICWSDSTINSVWFKFVSNGMDVAVTTDFDTPLNDTSIAVYSATDCADFATYTEVGCDTDGGDAGTYGWNSIARLTGLTAGDTYYIQVEGFGTKTDEFNIQVVDNDSFIMPYPITPSTEGSTCDSAAATFTAHLASDGTTDSGMDGSCNGDSTGLDRFFSWVATSEGLIWNDGDAGHPGIIIRDTDGNEIICEGTYADDDVLLTGWAIGDELIIQIYDYNDADVDVTFCLAEISNFPPQFTTTETTVDCVAGTFSVDVKVTALGGATTVTISDNLGNTVENVTTGIQTFGPYNEGDAIDFTVVNDTDATMTTTQSFTYYCPPANDNACSAEALTFDTIAVGTNLGATGETDEPAGECWFLNGNTNSVWYTFTPTNYTAVSVSTDFDTALDDTHFVIYEVTDCNDMTTFTPIGCGEDGGDTGLGYNSTVIVNGLTLNTTYYVQVDGYNSAMGEFNIQVTEISTPLSDCVTMDTPLNNATDVLSPVALTWTPATSGGTADSYNVYVSINGGTESFFNNYTDTFTPALGLEPDLTVTWRVVPVNAAGENTSCTSTYTFSSVVGTDDYDGDGVDNMTEYNDETDMTDPCSPAQSAGYTGYDASNAIWGAADCDGDGQNNAQEVAGGSDPYDATSTVSVEDLEAVGFEYYPNPVNSNLTVKANENITSIAIFNMLGQQVKQVNPSSLNATIDMTSLANGTYFIKATVGEKVGTFKIIKK